jgi:hypothetical protein
MIFVLNITNILPLFEKLLGARIGIRTLHALSLYRRPGLSNWRQTSSFSEARQYILHSPEHVNAATSLKEDADF